MNIKDHAIAKDLPELREQIYEMKSNNGHFAGLSDKYDELEHHIHLMESGNETYKDEQLEELKKKRLHLKDQMFSLLKISAAAS